MVHASIRPVIRYQMCWQSWSYISLKIYTQHIVIYIIYIYIYHIYTYIIYIYTFIYIYICDIYLHDSNIIPVIYHMPRNPSPDVGRMRLKSLRSSRRWLSRWVPPSWPRTWGGWLLASRWGSGPHFFETLHSLCPECEDMWSILKYRIVMYSIMMYNEGVPDDLEMVSISFVLFPPSCCSFWYKHVILSLPSSSFLLYIILSVSWFFIFWRLFLFRCFFCFSCQVASYIFISLFHRYHGFLSTLYIFVINIPVPLCFPQIVGIHRCLSRSIPQSFHSFWSCLIHNVHGFIGLFNDQLVGTVLSSQPAPMKPTKVYPWGFWSGDWPYLVLNICFFLGDDLLGWQYFLGIA